LSSRPLACAALAGALLAFWPGAAAAKGVFASVRACGPSACVTIGDRADRVALSRVLDRSGTAFPRLGAYLRVTTRPGPWADRGYLLPAQGILQLNGVDHRLGGRAAASLRRRLATIAPYRPRVSAVWVHGRRVARPGAVAAALRSAPVAEPAAVWSSRSVLVSIDVAGATPWSGWDTALYFPALRVLHSADGAWVRLTAAQARALTPVGAGAAGGGGAGAAMMPVAAVAAVAAVMLAAGGLAAVRIHRPRASGS
jgi:hypothetical protein